MDKKIDKLIENKLKIKKCLSFLKKVKKKPEKFKILDKIYNFNKEIKILDNFYSVAKTVFILNKFIKRIKNNLKEKKLRIKKIENKKKKLTLKIDSNIKNTLKNLPKIEKRKNVYKELEIMNLKTKDDKEVSVRFNLDLKINKQKIRNINSPFLTYRKEINKVKREYSNRKQELFNSYNKFSKLNKSNKIDFIKKKEKLEFFRNLDYSKNKISKQIIKFIKENPSIDNFKLHLQKDKFRIRENMFIKRIIDKNNELFSKVKNKNNNSVKNKLDLKKNKNYLCTYDCTKLQSLYEIQLSKLYEKLSHLNFKLENFKINKNYDQILLFKTKIKNILIKIEKINKKLYN